MSTEEWVQKARSVWGDKYDYSQVNFSGTKKKVTIYCPMHNTTFTQLAYAHTRGQVSCPGCKKEAVTKAKGPKPISTQEWVEKAKSVWGDKYDYSDTEFIDTSHKVRIYCPEHRLYFSQRPSGHLDGHLSCPGCNPEKMTQEQYIEKAREVWGDSIDYSKTKYTGQLNKSTFICVEHSLEFEQEGKGHLRGYKGCPKCNPHKPNRDRFISKAASLWGDRWDYSEVEYRSMSASVKLKCREHDRTFYQTPASLLKGAVGCPLCTNLGVTNEEFVKRASKIWDNRWDYSATTYAGMRERIVVNCPLHGAFYQIAATHISGGVGCPSCQAIRQSKPEMEILDFINSLGFNDAVHRKVGAMVDSNMEIDIYVPSRKIGIEFNGVYYHSEKFRDKNYHLRKHDTAMRSGIRLLQIWEDDYRKKPEIVKSHIKHVLGVSTEKSVYARKTKVVHPSTEQAVDFLSAYHIQGVPAWSKYVGLAYEGKLVALAGFQKQGEDYVLSRYATSCKVVGGHSKIVSWFEKNVSYRNLITFADLTFSDGDLYRSTGWNEDKLLKPDYSYLVDNVRQHKFGYRINRFKSDPKLRYVEGMTERELADLNGLLRVYDAGKIRFVKPHPDSAEERI